MSTFIGAIHFTIYDGQVIEGLAAVFGQSATEFLANDLTANAVWSSGNSELYFNLYFADNGKSWVFSRDTDVLKLDFDQIDETVQATIHVSDIIVNQSSISSDEGQNLIIGTEGDDSIRAGYHDDVVYGGLGNDVIHASLPEGSYYHGDSIAQPNNHKYVDQVDYSSNTYESITLRLGFSDLEDARAYQTAALEFQKDNPTFFPVYDRLVSIEHIVMSEFDDYVHIADIGAINITIDGGDGFDTLYIPLGIGSIVDHTIGSYSGGVFADKRMIPLDYTNIERIYLDGTPSTIALSKSPLDGLQFNTQYMDYSAVSAEMDFNFIADSRLKSPSYGFDLYRYDQNYYAIAEGDSFRNTGAGYSNEGYVDRSSLSNTIIHRYVVGAAHIHGSDHGDTITIRSAHTIPTDIDFVAGYGDDAIDVSGSVGSRYGGSVAITYTKGNDILTGDDRGITKLQMWAAIRPSDVHITDDLITIDGYGSIALSGLEGSELNIEYLGTEKSATIDGSWSDESWNGYDGRDEIFYGFGGNDTLNGNGGQDQLYGGSGSDTLSSLKGANVLEGGLDDDVYYVSKNALTTITDQYGNNALYTTDFNKADMRFAMNEEGNLVIEDTAGNATITISIDSVFGQIEFQDGETITLDDALLQAQGNVATYNTSEGSDIAHSRGGEGDTVVVDLKGGSDSYYAGSRDISDVVYGGDGGEFIQSGLGDDTLYGGKGDDYHLDGEEGNDYIDGGDGRDTYILHGSSGVGGHVDLGAGIAYNDGSGGTDILVSIEGVYGTGYDDLIIGDNENNHLLGEEGNDTLYGKGGDDSFEFEGYNTGDGAFVDGGEGSDRLYYGLLEDYRVVADLGAGLVSENGRGGQDIIVSIENIVGSALGGDHITGSDESNEIYLAGFYGEGSTALGMGGDDIIYGSYYDDTLSGGDGIDVLLGRDGNDTLIGGAGNDTLAGGAGDDTYIFAAGDGIDIIRDTEGENILVIEGDIALDELVTTRKGNDLILHIASGVTFENYYESEPADNAFTLSFTDGTQIDAKAIEVNNAAPVAQDDAFDLLQNSSVTGNVLYDNGYGEDADPDANTIEVVAGAFVTEFGGTLQLSEDGSFTYTPEQDFSGFDTVSYSITDGYEGTDTAEVSFFVGSVNTGPEANDDNVQAVEDTAITIDVLANDNDVDGDILNISIEGSPLNGSVVINADQTITYTPDDNYNGDDSFNYGVDDGHGGTDSATVSLSVSAVNDNPIAQNDTVNTQYNQALLLTAAQLTANDSDIENDTLEIASVQNAQNGAVVLNSDGSVSFTPDTNFSGAARFEYTLSDGNGGTSTASVNVAVSSPPDNNDVLYGTEGDDNLFGTRENDIIEAKGGDDRVFARNGNDEVHGGSGNDWLFGGKGDDLLYGNDGDDFLFGQRGSNEMSGGAGDDLIAGSSGRDVLSGENGDDLLLGNNGNDVLDGGQGSDRLYGGRGDDLLFFGEGADYLYGGSGRDVFKAIAVDTIESATIRDFDAREDLLDISDILTGYDPIADVLSDFVNVEASRSRATVYIDRDGSGSEHAWEQLVQMQVKGASNISEDEDQLIHQGILVV